MTTAIPLVPPNAGVSSPIPADQDFAAAQNAQAAAQQRAQQLEAAKNEADQAVVEAQAEAGRQLAQAKAQLQQYQMDAQQQLSRMQDQVDNMNRYLQNPTAATYAAQSAYAGPFQFAPPSAVPQP